MKHGRGYRLLSQKGAAGHFWLSLVCFSALVIASFLLFEQQIQDFLTHLNLYQPSTPAQKLYLALLLVALLALDVVLPVPSSMVALLAVAMLGSVGVTWRFSSVCAWAPGWAMPWEPAICVCCPVASACISASQGNWRTGWAHCR